MTKEERAKLLEEGKTEVEISQLEAIEELKTQMDTMVDPDEFKKLQEEYDKLLKDYVNKRPVKEKKAPEVIRPAKEIAQEISKIENGNISNREYIAKALEYRKAFMNESGIDPFSDNGEITEDSKEVAGKLQKLLDENESASDFRMRMNTVLKDDPQLLRTLNKRKK